MRCPITKHDNPLKTFEKLKRLSAFRREQLLFLRTLEDQDLVREIGYHQERGSPVTMKVLLLAGIASTATVQRRLARLRKLGVVLQSRASHDARVVKLTLSARQSVLIWFIITFFELRRTAVSPPTMTNKKRQRRVTKCFWRHSSHSQGPGEKPLRHTFALRATSRPANQAAPSRAERLMVED